ncbi:MAG TPA: hypothetical protein DEO71_22470 [Chryseobacterium sp.]|nr:hypothetical protein [Chryseobacterium sp.]
MKIHHLISPLPECLTFRVITIYADVFIMIIESERKTFNRDSIILSKYLLVIFGKYITGSKNIG